MVPGVLLGLEPLRGAGKGYQESLHKLGDLWARPQWRSVCGALSQLVTVPAGNRLWFDTADIAALQDGALQRGQTALVNMQAVLTARQAGYSRESIPAAVNSGDVLKLVPDPSAAPPANQPVQHMLPQGQPGATATPLPAGTQTRLPTGSVSPGDGGNSTRPAPQLASVRRAEPDGEDPGEEQVCPACGAQNGPDALYCSQCGAELPDGPDDEPDDGMDGLARFNTAHFGAGAKGGQFAPSGGGGGGAAAKNGTKPTGATKTAPAAHGPGHGAAEQKAALHARAAADRAKARQLEHELHVLEHQHRLAHSAAVKAAAAAKAAGAGKHVAHHAAHHRKARRKTHRAHSLKARIASLRHRIATLRRQASELDARAAKL
jgi:hypothetical protein